MSPEVQLRAAQPICHGDPHTAPQINPFSAIMVRNGLEGTIPESLAEKTKEFE